MILSGFGDKFKRIRHRIPTHRKAVKHRQNDTGRPANINLQIAGMMNDTNTIGEAAKYYLTREEPNRSCLLAIRSIILNQDVKITETQKWGMPCFCYQKRVFCYLWTDRKTDKPYILMVEESHLDHPELEAGTRSKMKIFRVDPEKDLPIRTIRDILQRALDLYRTGMIKLKE